jgi:hypothetical protein
VGGGGVLGARYEPFRDPGEAVAELALCARYGGLVVGTEPRALQYPPAGAGKEGCRKAGCSQTSDGPGGV